jgi:hypothetical protein
MLAVSAAEMAALRADVAAAACDTSCVIKRKVATPDGRLTNTEVYNTVATVLVGIKSPTVAAMRSSRGMTQELIELIGSQTIWEINFPFGTDVRHQDHLVIGADTMVVLVDISQQSYSTLVTVIAGEIK